MPDLVKLRNQIAAGEYRLDASSIASALLEYAESAESAGSTLLGGEPVSGSGPRSDEMRYGHGRIARRPSDRL